MTQSEALFLQQVAKSFGNACDSYLAAARLQQQVALEALALLPENLTGHLLDLGCGPGWIHPQFTRFCQQFTAVDLSAAMLAKAASQQLAAAYILADAEQLPLPDASVDKVFSSLMLQWCANPHAALSHIARVLTPGGQAVVTTLVAGSLLELQQAFACVDDKQHVNHFLPVQQLKAAASRINGITWHFIERSYTLYYPDVQNLARELKALGANQVAGRQQQGLTGKGYWQKLAKAYNKTRTIEGLPATYQVLQLVGVKNGA